MVDKFDTKTKAVSGHLAYKERVMVIMERAANELAMMDRDNQRKWISYFLECLEFERDEETLNLVGNILNERFVNGRW